jgi:radical SAM superfamily enzyme YgiQ (UPF0313 family)
MSIQKILFLLPPYEKGIDPYGYTFLPPFGLGVLAGYLKQQGYAVDLQDLNRSFSQKYSDIAAELTFLYDREEVLGYLNGNDSVRIEQYLGRLLEGIPLESYDLVGISSGADFTFMQIHTAFLIGKYIAKKYQKQLVFGGNNITFLSLFPDVFGELWTTVLKNFPYIIKGPGEIAVSQLIDYINHKDGAPRLEEIGGLVYWKDGILTSNKEYEPEIVRPDWCNLPLDYYSIQLKDVNQDGAFNDPKEHENLIQLYKWPFYLTQYVNTIRKKRQDPGYSPKLVLPYVFNYHCPFSCAFCTQSDIDKKRVILGEVEAVIADLEFLMNRYQTNYFYFFNNAFNASAKFSDALCRELIRRGIRINWSDCGRFNNLNLERLQLMKKAGCRKLVFGFETGSEKLLKLVDKKLDLRHAEQILEYCRQLGIWADLEIIVGLPQEDDSDYQATVDFVERNKAALNYMTINEYFIVPNSLIGRYPERYGIEILRNVTSYAKILEKGLQDIQKAKIKQGNFKIYRYNEIGGRDYRQVTEKTRDYIKKMNDLQLKEFAEVEYVYRILEKKLTNKGAVSHG